MSVFRVRARPPLPWLPALLFWGAALTSVGLLVVDHRRLQDTLEASVAAVDNMTQARLHVVRAFLVAERLAAGDPTFEAGRPLAELDQAIDLVEDLLAGRSSVLGMQATVDPDGRHQELAERYLALLRSLRTDLAEERLDTGDAVGRRLRFARLQDASTALEARSYDLLRERLTNEAATHRMRVALWAAFLLIVGASFALQRRARVRDARAHGRAQAAREEAERRYAALAEHAAAGIVRTNAEGSVLEATQWWVTGLGIRESGWIGNLWWEILPERERGRASELWAARASRRESFSLEVRFVARNGQEHWLGSRWAPVEPLAGAEEGSWIGTFIDQTDRKGIEERLQQAQKLEAVGRLSSGIAHDFNNLLTVVASNAEMLHIERGLPESALELVEDIETAARSGRDLVKGLMGFSRPADLEIRPIDLGDVVRETGRLGRRLLPASIQLGVFTAERGPWVHADGRAVQQILINLLSNARDAMPQGGHVTVEVDRVEVDAEYLAEHPWVEPGDFGRVTVSDEGLGMEEDTLKRIFDPFFSTKKEGEGTGLGLATVHALIRRHGGHVHVYSEPERGTTFKVYLPLAEAAADELAVPEAAVEGPATGEPEAAGGVRPLRILVVDDDDVLRRTAMRILVRVGHQAIEAANGREALVILEERGGEIDLVISDVTMDELGGLELYEELRRRGDTHPFLFTSGYSPREATVRDGIPADVVYLAKPWTMEELQRAIIEAC